VFSDERLSGGAELEDLSADGSSQPMSPGHLRELTFWERVFPYSSIPLWRFFCAFAILGVFLAWAGHHDRLRARERREIKRTSKHAV
jgi:hypothetical protein